MILATLMLVISLFILFYNSTRISKSDYRIRYIFDNHTACTNHTILTNMKTLDYARSNTNPCAFSYSCTTTDIHSGSYMAIVFYYTFMINSRTRIDYTMFPYYSICINNRTRHDYCTFTNLC